MLLEKQPDIPSKNIRLSQPEHARAPPKKRIVSNPASSVPSPPRKRKQQSKSQYKQKPSKKAKVKNLVKRVTCIHFYLWEKPKETNEAESKRVKSGQIGSNCQEIRLHQMYIGTSLLRRQSYPMQIHKHQSQSHQDQLQNQESQFQKSHYHQLQSRDYNRQNHQLMYIKSQMPQTWRLMILRLFFRHMSPEGHNAFKISNHMCDVMLIRIQKKKLRVNDLDEFIFIFMTFHWCW